MRVVLDTNVLVSGLLSPHGPPGRIADMVVDDRLWPLYDDRILDEYRSVLRRDRFAFASSDVRDFLEQLQAVGEHVVPEVWPGKLTDPDDRPFLEVARTARARALVTGNEGDFEPTRGSHSVAVISPRQLLERMTGR